MVHRLPAALDQVEDCEGGGHGFFRADGLRSLVGDRVHDHVGDIVDEKTRTVKVRVVVRNEDRLLKPNMYIQGIVQTSSSHERALVVPEDAVQNLEGQKVVFISDEEGVFSARIVETGERVESGIVVTRGLQPGERIVVKGSFTIKSELTKSSAPDSHAH